MRRLVEGTSDFDRYRDNSLRDVERRLFLSVSHYRRSFDLMSTSAAMWAHVTLYYASFFAASALLGMFGCYANERSFVVEVGTGLPGSQRLVFNTQVMSQLGLLGMGSHARFWGIFYNCSRLIYPWEKDPTLKQVLDPSWQGTYWQIDTRNVVNYDTYESLTLMTRFKSDFNSAQFPACLQGDLITQLTIADYMTKVAFKFAKQFNLTTDALNDLTAQACSREDKIRELIRDQPSPNLSNSVPWASFI